MQWINFTALCTSLIDAANNDYRNVVLYPRRWSLMWYFKAFVWAVLDRGQPTLTEASPTPKSTESQIIIPRKTNSDPANTTTESS